ncbi:MAG TPA: hypothetical protein VMH80_26895 [Bryobacteraceae bacterium]|nr:hypothetical protein [Bryobacteraceae bacterium]
MPSDRERWNLRGPVHTCRLERTWQFMRCGTERCEPETGGDVSMVEFRPDGALLQRWHRNPDGSEWTSTYEYDGNGRLLAIRTQSLVGESNREIREYDDAGRLTRRIARNADGRERVVESYEYPSAGRQAKIFHVDPRGPTINGWGVEGAVGIFSAPGAATVTKIYEREHPVEVLFHDAAGVLLSRVDFRYDQAGNLVEEAQSKLAFLFPAETQSQMSVAQMETIHTMFGDDGHPLRQLHRYDGMGNRIESISEMGLLGQYRRQWTYNSHGDQISEVDEDEHMEYGISDTGQLSEGPTKETRTRSEARFRYQYDAQGNWIEKIVENRAGDNNEFRLSSTERRSLTYHVS